MKHRDAARRPTLLAGITTIVALMTMSLGFSAPATAGEGTVTRTLTFTSTVTSVGTDLTELPGDIVYGWNHLKGKTKWGKRTASLDFLGSVDYIDGSGPFGGFVTITHPKGYRLALRVNGESTSPPGPGTKDAIFTGTVHVIGGSGPFTAATGVGTMTGSRTAALGGAVRLTFAVTVTRPA